MSSDQVATAGVERAWREGSHEAIAFVADESTRERRGARGRCAVGEPQFRCALTSPSMPEIATDLEQLATAVPG